MNKKELDQCVFESYRNMKRCLETLKENNWFTEKDEVTESVLDDMLEAYNRGDASTAIFCSKKLEKLAE